LLVGNRRLIGIVRRVRIVHEISRGREACRILLLLGILGLLDPLSLRLENWVWKGGRSGRISSSVGSILGVIVPEVEIETIRIAVLHFESDYRLGLRGGRLVDLC
jgi:hypothetical protein